MVRRHLPIGPVFARGRMREEHPRHPRSLSFADLCWYIQEQAFGGLDADTAKVLEGLARSVGLPGKSGVGGGILAIVPGVAALAVWSPGLNIYGNSLLGTRAMELLAERSGWSVFSPQSVQRSA